MEIHGIIVPHHAVHVWKVVPFGLAPSGPVFQSRMETHLQPLGLNENAWVFFVNEVERMIRQACAKGNQRSSGNWRITG